MNVLLITLVLLLNSALSQVLAKGSLNLALAPLLGSSEHNSKHNCQIVGPLNPQMNLTLTIVTGSMDKTELVAEYFLSFDFLTITDKTEMHFKLKGTVAQFAQVFNTTFIEYSCPNSPSKQAQYATTSEVYIPQSLHSSIVSILGLETVIKYRPHHRNMPSSSQKSSTTTYSYFTGNEAAQVYGAPSGKGTGVKVGIVTLGGYFIQADLQKYFTQFGLGKAPTIKIAYVDGAKQDRSDADSSVENYIDIEILSSVAPQAIITLYFGPNTDQGFYDVFYQAITKNNIVSCSWGSNEYQNPHSYMQIFQTLFAKYSHVPVFAASGDFGSYSKLMFSDGGVGFPSSCPNAIGEFFDYLEKFSSMTDITDG